LKKYCSYSAARNFGVLARLSEGACPQRPVTERKRSQNPKEPLPLSPQPDGYSIFENALKVKLSKRKVDSRKFELSDSSPPRTISTITISRPGRVRMSG
jgi:hypothetical protein